MRTRRSKEIVKSQKHKQVCKMTTDELQRAPCTMCEYMYIYIYMCVHVCMYVCMYVQTAFGNVLCIFCNVRQCEQVKMWTLLCSLLHQINSFLGNTTIDLCWSCLHQIHESASIHFCRHNAEKQTWPSTCLVVLNCLREVVVLFLLTAPHFQIQMEVGPSCDLQLRFAHHCLHSCTKGL